MGVGGGGGFIQTLLPGLKKKTFFGPLGLSLVSNKGEPGPRAPPLHPPLK